MRRASIAVKRRAWFRVDADSARLPGRGHADSDCCLSCSRTQSVAVAARVCARDQHGLAGELRGSIEAPPAESLPCEAETLARRRQSVIVHDRFYVEAKFGREVMGLLVRLDGT